MAISRDLTKEQLYRQAKRLGIKNRSKMSKSQLKTAVGRHHR
jgi:Rho termination factor, N-terminal domain